MTSSLVKSNNTTRNKLIETTGKLLQLHGYSGTGLNEIIKQSGAPKGSLYYHFPEGKEQLAYEAIERTKENVTNFIKESLARYDDPIEAIQNFIYDSAKRFEADSYFNGVPIANIVLEISKTNDRLRELCRKVFESWHEAFADKLKSGGYSDEESWDLAMTINAMIQGAFVICLTRQDSKPLLVMAEQIPVMLVKGK